MDKFASDNLILLEFLVDNISFESSVQESLQCMRGQNCVGFQFLDNLPIYVCEEDFAPNIRTYGDGCGGCSTLKNGKSCLFAMTGEQARTCMRQFDVYVEVFRVLTEGAGAPPAKVVLGESLVSILKLFQELVQDYNENDDEDNEPVAKTLKDCFKIETENGDLVGRIGIYIRMSTFGKVIVTKFRMNMQDKSVEFKARKGHYLFTSKANDLEVKKNQQYDTGSLSNQNVYDIPCGKPKDTQHRPCGMEPVHCPMPMPLSPMANPAMNPMMLPGAPGSMPPQQFGFPEHYPPTNLAQGYPAWNYAASPTIPVPCRPMCPPQPYNPAANFGAPYQPMYSLPPVPSFGTSMPYNQHKTASMQTHPRASAPPKFALFEELEEIQCPIFKPDLAGPQRQPHNDFEMQMKNYKQQPTVPPPPNCGYQEFGAEMGGNSLIIRVHKDRATVEQNADETCCCDGGKTKPAVYQVPNPSPCSCVNAQTGVVPKSEEGLCPSCCPDNNQPFTFKMGGTTQVANNISLVSPTCNLPKDATLGPLSDATKEVFILRIGKKNESAAKKNNLEIELCTPRGKEYKPPAKKMDMEQQCEQTENKPTKGDGDKKGKGKGDKKAKKKK